MWITDVICLSVHSDWLRSDCSMTDYAASVQ